MANTLANSMANICAACGANLDMVGRVHRCISRAIEVAREPLDRKTVRDTREKNSPGKAAESQGPAEERRAAPRAVESGSTTYKYRDADDRREKMRLYMRDYRAKKRGAEKADGVPAHPAG